MDCWSKSLNCVAATVEQTLMMTIWINLLRPVVYDHRFVYIFIYTFMQAKHVTFLSNQEKIFTMPIDSELTFSVYIMSIHIFFMLEDMGPHGERIVIKTMYSSKCFLNSWFMIVHTDSCIFVCLQMYSFSASEFMWSFLIKNREVSPDDQTGERVCMRLIHGLKFNLWPYGTFPVLETASFVFP